MDIRLYRYDIMGWIYICIYIYRERAREGGREGERERENRFVLVAAEFLQKKTSLVQRKTNDIRSPGAYCLRSLQQYFRSATSNP
jgi:hypothetical protein